MTPSTAETPSLAKDSLGVVDAAPPVARPPKGAWQVIATLVPYLMKYKLRMGLALAALVAAKLANVSIPVFLKEIVDGLTPLSNSSAENSAPVAGAVLAIPLALVVGYGL
ncbi:MAG: hypothetical protein ACO3WN_08850, partial [Burkholderiaceae bacterium]